MSDEQLTLPVRNTLFYPQGTRLRLEVREKLDKPLESPVVVADRDASETALMVANGGHHRF